MTRQTVCAVFDDPIVALDAGERARVVAGPSGVVQVLVPGGNGKVVRTAVRLSKGGRWAVLVIGALVGTAFVVGLTLSTRLAWTRFAAVITAVLFAGMIYAWLKGSFAARSRRLDLLRASEEAEVRAGHSVVHAEVFGPDRVEQVKKALSEAGGGELGCAQSM
jgi:hypothetical protein